MLEMELNCKKGCPHEYHPNFHACGRQYLAKNPRCHGAIGSLIERIKNSHSHFVNVEPHPYDEHIDIHAVQANTPSGKSDIKIAEIRHGRICPFHGLKLPEA
jgi:hypothetical protein